MENINKYQLDNLDKEILALLIKDAKIPYTEIAKRLVVSPGTIHVRTRKMEELGIIKGATLIIDHQKLGYDLTAFVGIYLVKGSVYEEVISDLEKINEVVEAHYTTGTYSIFVKIVSKNTNHLRKVIGESIQRINGVIRTETIVSLSEHIHKPITIS
ncbi:MAG: Lrp/AsnC ligand binding domain-containing protein [Bacteroidota bacterium]